MYWTFHFQELRDLQQENRHRGMKVIKQEQLKTELGLGGISCEGLKVHVF